MIAHIGGPAALLTIAGFVIAAVVVYQADVRLRAWWRNR
jgi:hypothetical protein